MQDKIGMLLSPVGRTENTTAFEIIIAPSNYLEAKENIENGLSTLGQNIDVEGLKEFYNLVNSNHPLGKIVNEYLLWKIILFDARLANNLEMIQDAKNNLQWFRPIIEDGFATLTAEELSKITIKNQYIKNGSLLIYLTHLGDIELFKLLFNKLKNKLGFLRYVQLLVQLYTDYLGVPLAEYLGLASSFLGRGDASYIEMTKFLLEALKDKEGMNAAIITVFLYTMNIYSLEGLKSKCEEKKIGSEEEYSGIEISRV